MAKMTIYVPADLKGRMDEVEGVNWSPLACQAFEAKLAEEIGRKGVKDMSDVVARLKASKAKSDSEMKKAGHMAGIDWAQSSAEAVQLERLNKLMQGYDWPGWLWTGNEPEHYPARLYFALFPEDDGDGRAAQSFWWKWSGNDRDVPGPDFLEGFTDGAMEVWDAVKDLL